MRIATPVLAVLALGFVSPALATEPEENAKEKTEEVKKAKEPKKICRRIATDMSSRRTERVCMTKEGWREFNNQR